MLIKSERQIKKRRTRLAHVELHNRRDKFGHFFAYGVQTRIQRSNVKITIVQQDNKIIECLI